MEQKHSQEEDQDAIMLIEVKQNERRPRQIHYVRRYPQDLTAVDLYLPGEVRPPHKLQTFPMLMLLVVESQQLDQLLCEK